MKYAFIAEHRPQYPVRRMCRCLNIHPSGFYAWIKNPLSHRAREDVRQTKLIEEAWNDSGKVYGYRKLHDDLLTMKLRTAGSSVSWPVWLGSALRSVTNVSWASMVEGRQSSSTTR